MPTNIQTILALGITNRIFSFYLTETHTCSIAYQYIHNRCMIAEEMYANVHIHITVFKIKVIVWLRSGFEKSSYIFYSVRLMFLVKSYSFILWWPHFFPSSYYLVYWVTLRVHFYHSWFPTRQHQRSICSSLNTSLSFTIPWFCAGCSLPIMSFLFVELMKF